MFLTLYFFQSIILHFGSRWDVVLLELYPPTTSVVFVKVVAENEKTLIISNKKINFQSFIFL